MKNERYKQIMKDLGMPNSNSLLVALKQVANEAVQEAAHNGSCSVIVQWRNSK